MIKYIRTGTGILVFLLIISTYTLYNRNQDLKEEISVAMSNQKAFIAENPSLRDNGWSSLASDETSSLSFELVQKIPDIVTNKE